MTTKKEPLLRNPDKKPTSDVIAEGLKEANDAYVKFIKELLSLDIQVEWHYYNDGKAWLGKGLYKWTGARGGHNEKTVFWLSIWDGFFKVTIYIPQKARQEISTISLDDEVRKVIEDSNQMGKLKFFPIVFDLNSDERFEAVFTLINYRKSIK